MTETENNTARSRKLSMSHFAESTVKKQIDVGIYLETHDDEDGGRLDVKPKREKS